MASDRKKAAPVKTARSHFQKAAFLGILGLVTTFYTTATEDGFGKLTFLQVAFFFTAIKSLIKGMGAANKTTPLVPQKPRRAALVKRRPIRRSTPASTPVSAPHLATNQVASPGHGWLGVAQRNWYWVVLFLVFWQVFERI